MFELTECIESAAKSWVGAAAAAAAVNTMISYTLRGVDFIIVNTDAQAWGMHPARP